MQLIEQHIKDITNLCQLHKVDSLFVFGSVLTDDFSNESDIDFLVSFGQVDPLQYFNNFMDFKESLESILKRSVDLIEENTIKNPFLKESINNHKQLIYGGARSKMAG